MSVFHAIHSRPVPADGLRPAAGGQRPAPRRSAWSAATLLYVVAAFHAAVVLGAPWGELTQGGGTSGTLPMSGRLVAAVSCILSIAMAGAILGRVGRGPFRRRSSRLVTVLAWFTEVYAVVGVVLNLLTRSDAERALWAPVSIVLLGLVTVVMVTTHRKAVVAVRSD
jgi:hypothetical protein